MAEQQETFTEKQNKIARAYNNLQAKQKQASEIGDENSVMKFGSQLAMLRNELLNVTNQKEEKNRLIDEELASGSFLTTVKKEGRMPVVSLGMGVPIRDLEPINVKEKNRQAIVGKLAERYEIDPTQLDIESGIPKEFRAKLSVLPSLQDKDEFLRSKYGNDNVDLKNINGDSAFFVKSGGKYVMVDESGFSGKDIIDTVGEAVPLLGTAVGALMTRTPQGGRAGAKLITQAIVSNAVGQAAGAVQDATAEAFLLGDPDKTVSLESIKPGEILTRRGVQAIQGAVLDYGVGKTLELIAKKSLPGITRKSAEEEIAAVRRLREKGFEVTESPGAFMAEGGVETMQRRAMQPLGGPLRERLSRNLDATEAFKRAAEGADPNKDVALASIFNGFVRRADSIARAIRSTDAKIGGILKSTAENRAKVFRTNRDITQIGKDLIERTKQLEVQQDKIKRQMFDPIFTDADAMGIGVNKLELLQRLKSAVSDPKYAFYQAGDANRITSIIEKEIAQARAGQEAANRAADIRARFPTGKATKEEFDSLPSLDAIADQAKGLSANYPLRSLDNITKAIKESIPADGVVATGNTSATIASFIEGEMDDLLLSKMTPELRDRFIAARDNFRENRIPFETDIGGLILRTDKGRSVTTPKQALDNLFSDPANPGRYIELVRGTDPQAVPSAIRQLQQGYLARLGAVQGRELPEKGLAYNEDVLMSVFGRNADGSANPAKGQAMKLGLDELNAALEAVGVKFSKFTDTTKARNLLIDDIAKLPDALDQATRKRVVAEIQKKAKLAYQAEKMFDNKVIETVVKQKGMGNTVSNDDFAAAMFGANPAKIKETMKAMSPDETTRARTAMARWLFKEYPPTYEKTQRTGVGLWDPDKFLRDFNGNTGLRQQMEAAFGKEFTKDMQAASVVLRSSRMAPSQSATSPYRMTVGKEGPQGYLAGKVDDYVLNPILAAAYGSNRLQPFLKFLAKNPNPAQVARQADAVMKSTITSNKGIGLLMDIASDDADTASWLMDRIGASAQAERDMLRKYKVQEQ